MSTITTRAGKGSPLTNNEVDANFTNLNTDKAELSGATFTGEITANAGIALGDNDKATFGAGDDLQIYHDGTHSYVSDQGTGSLFLRSGSNIYVQNSGGTANYFKGTDGGAAELFHNGSSKLATTSTGIDVTGTATMDGLTVDGGLDVNMNTGVADFSFNDGGYLKIHNASRTSDYRISTIGSSAEELRFRNGASQDLLRLNKNGDISFYEDTGTTPKLFWDASAESLGIGTSSPSHAIDLIGGGNYRTLRIGNISATGVKRQAIAARHYTSTEEDVNLIGMFGDATTTTVAIGGGLGATGDFNSATKLEFHTAANNTTTGTTAALTIDSSQNVGIGTSSPSHPLTIQGSGTSGNAIKILGDSTNDSGRILWRNNGDTSATASISVNSSEDMLFGTGGGTERMRIDSSGNLLVGKTAASLSTAGVTAYGGSYNGLLASVRDGGEPLYLNRLTSDGSIASFQKDGTTVGSIGSALGDSSVSTLFIADAGNVGIRFDQASTDDIQPCTSAGADRDNTINLGATDNRFKDLYLSGGVYLGGTGSANKLDDYEEGTWTPTFIGSTSGTMAVTAVVTSKYVKVGTLVTLSVYCTCNGLTHDLSGAVQIASLPFTAVSEMGVGVSPYSGLFTNNDVVVARALGSSLRLVKGSSKANYTNGDVLTNSTVLPFMLTASYHTT